VVTLRDFAWIDRKVVPIHFIFSLFVVCHFTFPTCGWKQSQVCERNFFPFFFDQFQNKLSLVAIVIA
jgi:hypothetical protein